MRASWERERHHPTGGARGGRQGRADGPPWFPVRDGGLGLGLLATANAVESVAAADMGTAFALKVHANFTASIATAGSDHHRSRYLADLLAGRLIGAFLLTEPGVGSDATAISTSARRKGGGWVIDGEKAWVTNGANAGLFKVFAQTDPAQGWARHCGLSGRGRSRTASRVCRPIICWAATRPEPAASGSRGSRWMKTP